MKFKFNSIARKSCSLVDMRIYGIINCSKVLKISLSETFSFWGTKLSKILDAIWSKKLAFSVISSLKCRSTEIELHCLKTWTKAIIQADMSLKNFLQCDLEVKIITIRAKYAPLMTWLIYLLSYFHYHNIIYILQTYCFNDYSRIK